MEPWQRLHLLLVLAPLLSLPTPASSSCILDDEVYNCSCNFSTPEPEWNSIAMCLSAVEVRIHGGGHDLSIFSEKAGFADLSRAVELLKALRLSRLELKEAQVPASLLQLLLRALSYTRIRELALEDLVISHLPLHPLSPGERDLRLTGLHLRRVSWAGEGSLLALIKPWLNPELKALSLTGLGLSGVPCPDLGAFQGLNSLDLSDNPEIKENALTAALCLKELKALHDLTLRNTSLQSLEGVCQGLETAGANIQRLDISYNKLRETASTRCTWPHSLRSLNLSHAELQCVPGSLPKKLEELDLSYNLLRKRPVLSQGTELFLEGNTFAGAYVSAGKEEPAEDCKNNGKKTSTWLALQVAGTALNFLNRGLG